MDLSNRIKTGGYSISSVSVLLLGMPALKGATDDPLMRALVIVGMATSIGGMVLRWWSYQVQKREQRGASD